MACDEAKEEVFIACALSKRECKREARLLYEDDAWTLLTRESQRAPISCSAADMIANIDCMSIPWCAEWTSSTRPAMKRQNPSCGCVIPLVCCRNCCAIVPISDAADTQVSAELVEGSATRYARNVAGGNAMH